MADECKMMVALQKFVDLGMNSTKLSKIAKGNTTKEADIKAAASVASIQVMMMEANTTLMAECMSMGISVSSGELPFRVSSWKWDGGDGDEDALE